MEILRRILRSPAGSIVAAGVTLTIGFALAGLVWRAREFIGLLLAALAITAGLSLAWQFLPFSPLRRRLWDAQSEFSDRFPSYRYRNLYGIALGWLAAKGIVDRSFSSFDLFDILFPGALLLVSLAASLIWRHRHKDEQARLAALRAALIAGR